MGLFLPSLIRELVNYFNPLQTKDRCNLYVYIMTRAYVMEKWNFRWKWLIWSYIRAWPWEYHRAPGPTHPALWTGNFVNACAAGYRFCVFVGVFFWGGGKNIYMCITLKYYILMDQLCTACVTKKMLFVFLRVSMAWNMTLDWRHCNCDIVSHRHRLLPFC